MFKKIFALCTVGLMAMGCYAGGDNAPDDSNGGRGNQEDPGCRSSAECEAGTVCQLSSGECVDAPDRCPEGREQPCVCTDLPGNPDGIETCESDGEYGQCVCDIDVPTNTGGSSSTGGTSSTGGAASTTGGASNGPVCNAGDTHDCSSDCPADYTGTQECKSDELGYTSCICVKDDGEGPVCNAGDRDGACGGCPSGQTGTLVCLDSEDGYACVCEGSEPDPVCNAGDRDGDCSDECDANEVGTLVCRSNETGYRCECEPECQVDADCDDDQQCDDGACVPTDNPPQCTSNDVCSGGRVCLGDHCGDCDDDQQCDAGMVCASNGRCVPETPDCEDGDTRICTCANMPGNPSGSQVCDNGDFGSCQCEEVTELVDVDISVTVPTYSCLDIKRVIVSDNFIEGGQVLCTSGVNMTRDGLRFDCTVKMEKGRYVEPNVRLEYGLKPEMEDVEECQIQVNDGLEVQYYCYELEGEDANTCGTGSPCYRTRGTFVFQGRTQSLDNAMTNHLDSGCNMSESVH